MKTKNILKNISLILIIFIAFALIFLAIYINGKFNNISFEQIIYSLQKAEGTSKHALLDGIIFVGSFATIFTAIVILISIILNFFVTKEIYFKKIKLYPLSYRVKLVLSLILLLISFIAIFSVLHFKDYVYNQTHPSTIFEDYYIDPKSVAISFPEEKKNLIYIYLESMEATWTSTKNGGYAEESLIPNLENLALNNINFSNSSLIGGARGNYSSSWTVASIVSQTAGIPLKVPAGIDYNTYIENGNTLAGAYSLGEVLAENGYKNYFLMGSDSAFGGRKEYLESHGNYAIYDYFWAIENGFIDKDYHVWWGYEDAKLFEYAELELTEIAQNDTPFNFSILTADTHFVDGYLESDCPTNFTSDYANSIYCSDYYVSEFIKWIQEQDFYEDTVIIITGDHLTMQADFYDKIVGDRTVYNTIINSSVTPINEKNRTFLVMDMYPTTLAALGASIPGNQLGLGVNLFSDKTTLSESLGLDYVTKELELYSDYYVNKILKNN